MDELTADLYLFYRHGDGFKTSKNRAKATSIIVFVVCISCFTVRKSNKLIIHEISDHNQSEFHENHDRLQVN